MMSGSRSVAAILLATTACVSGPALDSHDQAATFPTDDTAWRTVLLLDAAGDGAGGGRDLVGDADNPACQVWADASDLFVRMRLDTDPRAGGGVGPFGWGLAIDRDATGDVFEVLVLLEGIGTDELHVLANTTGAPGAGATFDTDRSNAQAGGPADGTPYLATLGDNVRVTEDLTGVGGTPDFLLDFAVPLANLSALGLAPSSLVRFACGASNNGADLSSDVTVTSTSRQLDGTSSGLDSDGDGVVDSVDNCPSLANPDQRDFDGDTAGDACDPDDDDDGALDGDDRDDADPRVCSDVDGDGCDDCSSGRFAPGDDGPDLDGDGRCDRGDLDGDGVLDGDDLDRDGDGLRDDEEGPPGLSPVGDHDGDGVANAFDADDRGDGQPQDCADGDGDRRCDAVGPLFDLDRDGVPDFIDSDSDDDGVADADEAGRGVDLDRDGRIDGPVGGNGLTDATETAIDSGVARAAPTDTDRDQVPDVRDDDSDGDGLPDALEAGDDDPATPPRDTDGDRSPDYQDRDSDNDGLIDRVERGDDDPATPPRDGDGDGVPDYLEADRDGDGVIDGADNCLETTNADQLDADFDGVGDACDPEVDLGDDGGCAVGGGASAVPLALAALALRRRRRRARRD